MEAYLFNTISDLKAHVGGGANLSLMLSSLKPTIYASYRKYIQAWLGDAQWNALVEAASPTAEQLALIEQVRAPLAMLTMYEYAKIGALQFGEMGLHRTETEERKSAFKYQENEYRDYMLKNGFEALEAMLDFLEANEDDYPLWTASAAYERNASLYINRAADFREAYSFSIDRYTYESLRALIADVETFAIMPFVGPAQHDALKAALQARSLTAAQSALVKLIQRAVANFTVELAAIRNWVSIHGNAVVQKQQYINDELATFNTASGDSVSALLSQSNVMANRHLSLIKRHLEANLEDYPLYAAYLDEAAEEAAGDAPAAPSFADARYWGAYNFSDRDRHNSRPRKGLTRL
jgi:hypothetical protein